MAKWLSTHHNFINIHLKLQGLVIIKHKLVCRLEDFKMVDVGQDLNEKNFVDDEEMTGTNYRILHLRVYLVIGAMYVG